ncbi:LysM peptidoglycan-binding domain-containing protein [Pseudomonas amygdali]|uniref:LysM domain-containing protein n=2 Tax=Pseudomonas amygdali pv. lachrymans TaxID=53707 RepID=A0ABR5KT10_PSEAV|nr:hypothetical protein [Pseudomonas amygdali]AXH60113.1 hypothetical protein PLA107_033425 [Pseudomonas amygdali pv. lachrymans str. M301315]KPC17519.1 Uncharacterized protein AC499_0721 [Pseudomonas amygdali pv. lachrymans]
MESPENLETKAVEPSLQASTDYLVALMVLKEVEAQNELDPLLHSLKGRLDKSKVGANPYHLLNTAFSQEAIVESKAAYAEIWEHLFKEIREANIKATLPHAGYSQSEIDSIPDEVIQHFNTVAVFEEKFPDEGSKKFPLVERLKVGKDLLFDALSSDKGKAALSAASWGISLATGGIVTRLAIKGGAALATRLIENESVHSFAGKVQQRVTNFMQRAGVPTGAIAGHFRDFKDNAKSVIASPTFQRYGKPSLALAGIALGAIMLGDINHDKIVELASGGLDKGADLASAGATAAVDLAHSGVDLAAEGVHAVKDGAGFVVDQALYAAKDTGRFLADGVVSMWNDPVATLHDIAGGTVDIAKSGYESATAALGGAADSVGNFAGEAIDSGRQFVADGFHKTGDLVAGVNAHDAASPVDAVIGDKQVLTDADVDLSHLHGAQAEAPAPSTAAVQGVAPTNYEIHKGDSLWKISKEAFHANGIEATDHQIHEATVRLYADNKDLIGANPDKIMTGHHLRVDPQIFAAKVEAVAAHDDLKSMSDLIGTKPSFPIESAAPSAPAVPHFTPPDLNALEQATPAAAPAPVPGEFKGDIAKLNDILSVTPKDGAVSFGEAVKRVASRDVGSDSTLGM